MLEFSKKNILNQRNLTFQYVGLAIHMKFNLIRLNPFFFARIHCYVRCTISFFQKHKYVELS
jgi:hypothetical protein